MSQETQRFLVELLEYVIEIFAYVHTGL